MTPASAAAAVPEELLAALTAYFRPRRVILFGSAAQSGAGADSDLDLLVVLDDDASPELLSWRAIHEARRSYRRPVDILVCRQSELDEGAAALGSLAHTISEDGVVVYERG